MAVTTVELRGFKNARIRDAEILYDMSSLGQNDFPQCINLNRNRVIKRSKKFSNELVSRC